MEGWGGFYIVILEYSMNRILYNSIDEYSYYRCIIYTNSIDRCNSQHFAKWRPCRAQGDLTGEVPEAPPMALWHPESPGDRNGVGSTSKYGAFLWGVLQ
jgi:hypothetical protein